MGERVTNRVDACGVIARMNKRFDQERIREIAGLLCAALDERDAWYVGASDRVVATIDESAIRARADRLCNVVYAVIEGILDGRV